MLTLTEATCVKVKELFEEENNPALKLRVFVQGGGCSGMSYGFSFDESQNEDDFNVEKNGIVVLIDAMSMQYLTGAVIDYKEDLMGAGFSISNPNAQTSCGCGSSFSVADNLLDNTEYNFHGD
jgi:iron-sulfur cluster insertion protein